MMNHPPLTQRCVQHFSEMGSRWGIGCTVGQIYALLLNVEEISEKFAFFRSNMSMGLKALQFWHPSLMQMRSKVQRFLEIKEPVKQIYIRTSPIADTIPFDLKARDPRLSSRFSHSMSSTPNTEADHG